MRRTILTMGAVFLFFPAIAMSQSDDALKSCKGYSSIARDIMEERQAGHKMSDLMEVASSTEDLGEPIKMLIIRAFEEKKHHSDWGKTRAVGEFENEIYLMCVKGFREREKK